jgi:hypothetical protein
MLLAGTRWTLHTRDGAAVGQGEKRSIRATFEANQYTIDTACGVYTGGWRQSDASLVLMHPEPFGDQRCSPPQQEVAQSLAGSLAGELHYVVGSNGEIVLAGPRNWWTGQRDWLLGASDSILTGARWRVFAIDGRPSEPAERPAELAFAPGFYSIWDSCRRSEGVMIIQQRQLFTHGSNVVTHARCPADPVRSKINSIVASSPRVALAGNGDVVLVSRAGALSLRRVDAIAGTAWRTGVQAGMTFDLLSGSAPARRLVLGPRNRFTFTLGCTTLTGRWWTETAPVGQFIRLVPDGAPPDCADSPDEEPLYGFFLGEVQVVVGPNQDVALFVSKGQQRAARLVQGPARDR